MDSKWGTGDGDQVWFKKLDVIAAISFHLFSHASVLQVYFPELLSARASGDLSSDLFPSSIPRTLGMQEEIVFTGGRSGAWGRSAGEIVVVRKMSQAVK